VNPSRGISPKPRPSRAPRRPRPRRALLLWAAAFALASTALAGCGGFLSPRPDPSRFYVLTPNAQPGDRRVNETFGIGPVTMPDYLKRSTIVTRTTRNEITPSGVDRWGEALDSAIPRTLQENLRRLLGTDRIVLFPWYATNRPDVQVAIDILRFERDSDGNVVLHARWELRRGDTSALLRAGDASLSRQGVQGADASVAAQSDLLAELSEQIATAIRALGPVASPPR
jgi:uncharacterized lipoprotein YmbA